MKKQIKKEKTSPSKVELGHGWTEMTGTNAPGYHVEITSTGTSDLHKVRQSVNQKVERSEEDVKERFNQVVTPLAFLIIIDILISFVNLIR